MAAWNLEEAIGYYKTQGAPQNQTALVNLLKEVQQESGGGIPRYVLKEIAEGYAVKESLLQAIIKRIPSLRLEDVHCMELCAGPNCGKHKQLAAYAEKLQKDSGGSFALRYSPCMRMCGKGPNVRWDGVLHHKATEELLEELVRGATK